MRELLIRKLFAGMLLTCFSAMGTAGAEEKTSLSGKPPAADDVLMLRYGDDPDTVNVILSNDTASEDFQRFVYDSLATRKYSDPNEWDPELAESWTFDEKTLTYTIQLRKGVYWHPMQLPNGKELPRTEFTSRDVKFTFDTILNENTEAAAFRSYYMNPTAKTEAEKYKIKVTTHPAKKYEVKVQWTEPYILSTEFTLSVPVIPRHVYGADEKGEPITLDFRGSKEFAEKFNNHWANSKMCGTGPLIFKEWVKDQKVTLERNPDYWGRPFFFSKIVYKHVSNENTALQMLKQNELDSSAIPEKDLYVEFKKSEPVASGKVKPSEYEYPAYRYLGYNLKREFFRDQKVRRAIAHTIPIDDIIAKIYHGLAVPVTGPFQPSSPENNASLKRIEYDLEKARSLLDAAGWKDSNENGTRDKMVGGNRVEAVFDLMIFSDSPSFRQIAEVIKENCRKVGIDVKISPTKWALMLQKLRKKEFDACILGWAMSWKTDPFQIWHGSQADLPESSNSIGYRNAQVDALIDKLRVTIDEKAQEPLYHEIHRLIYEDQPYVFLFAEKRTGGRHARLENVNFYKLRPCVDVREWYSTTPRAQSK